MTGRLSDTAENDALGLLMGGTAWVLTNKHWGLATATMTDATTGSTVTEPSGTYARQTMSGADWGSAASRQVVNGAEKSFPVVGAAGAYTASWMFEADALTSGDIIWYDELGTAKNASVGSTPKIAISAATLIGRSVRLSDASAHAIFDHIVGNATLTPAAIYYLALNRRPTKLGDVTANASTDELTLTSHGLADGDIVTFTTTASDLPAGLSEQTRYVVHSQTANTFEVRTIPNDATTNVDITDTGTGTHSVHRAGNMDGAYIYEADYGTQGRVSKTNNTTNFPAPSGGATDNGTTVVWATADWDGGTDEIAEVAIWDADIGTGQTVTFTNATNLLNDTAHGLSAGDKILLRNSGGALPAELEQNRVYFVINANANDFQVALTSGGSAVTFTDDGTGTSQWHSLGELVWVGELLNPFTPTANDTVDAAVSALTFTFT
jgi:hypothetical protein